MGLENGGNSPTSSKLNRFEQAEFTSGAKLTRDSFNVWEAVKLWFDEKAECEQIDEEFRLGPLKPIPHYEDIYRETKTPEALAELLERSDPAAIAAFNALADEFNSQLDSIDQQEAMAFVRRAVELSA